MQEENDVVEDSDENVAFSLSFYEAFLEVKLSSYTIWVGVVGCLLCVAFYIYFFGLALNGHSVIRPSVFVGGAFVLLLMYLMPKTQRILKYFGVQEHLREKYFPKELTHAPTDLKTVENSYFVYLNKLRKTTGLKMQLGATFRGDLNYSSFQTQVEDLYSSEEIYYDFPGHRANLHIDEMNEGVLYLQCAWNAERKLVTSILKSVVEYTEDGRTLHILEMDDKGSFFHGMTSDTISLGARSPYPEDDDASTPSLTPSNHN